MDERKEERKAKWEQPEIEEFQGEQEREASADEEYDRKHGCGPNQGGCRPAYGGGCPPQHGGGCRPQQGGGGCNPGNFGCHPRMCAPRKGCYPLVGFLFMGPYCRPYGFNYGYGCFPRR